MATLMWCVRYVTVLTCECLYSLPEKGEVQAMGHKKGGWGALWAWSRDHAEYGADNHHPLYYCVFRGQWREWMQQD